MIEDSKESGLRGQFCARDPVLATRAERSPMRPAWKRPKAKPTPLPTSKCAFLAHLRSAVLCHLIFVLFTTIDVCSTHLSTQIVLKIRPNTTKPSGEHF
jgi:hypothetical protein